MDRQIIYSGQVPQTTDLLNTNKQTMIALAKLCADLFGTATMATGLACVPTTPASMSVNINPGQIYQLANVDGTAYSAIPLDTTHSILKQGILLDAQNFAITAPSTAGYSQNYLIQATYLDNDINNTVLPYYNSANPTQAFNGPGGNGTSQPTTRAGQVSLQLVAGTAAATGSQTTPAVTTGYVGLWVITVANGQSTITAGNIAQYAGAPFFPGFTRLDGSTPFTSTQQGVTPPQFDTSTKLATMAAVQRALGNFRGLIGIGSAPGSPLDASYDGQIVALNPNAGAGYALTMPPANAANAPNGSAIGFFHNGTSGTFTLNANGTDNFVVAGASVTSFTLNVGQMVMFISAGGGYWYPFSNNSYGYTPGFQDSSTKFATTQWARTPGNVPGQLINVQLFTANGTYTPTSGTKAIIVKAVGGGGAGGGASTPPTSNASAGGGGGGGAYAEVRLTTVPASVAVTVGAGGTGVSGGTGNSGGTTSFGAYLSVGGGSGGIAVQGSTFPLLAAPGSGSASISASGVTALDQCQGGAGTWGQISSYNGQGLGGAGGASLLGFNAVMPGNGGAGVTGSAGSGGSGVVNTISGNAAAAGGAGAPGLVIVYEYA